MSTGDRYIPPSSARVAQAARAGLFARSFLLAAGLTMLAFSVAIAFSEQALFSDFAAFVKNYLAGAVSSHRNPGEALRMSISQAAAFVLPLFAAIFAAALTGAFLPALIAKRSRGKPSVPLPPAPEARFASTVLRMFGLFLAAALIIHAFRTNAGFVTRLMTGDFSASHDVFEAVYKLIGGVGLVMILVGLAETAVLKNEIWKALHLNSLEAKREERAAGGDRTVRREGARRARRQS